MVATASAGVYVLVLDDDEVMRELLSALLEAEGHRTQTAETGEQALAIIQREAALEIVLTDLRMPNTEIAELLRELRAAMSAEARLIGMSGSAAEASELELLDGFLLKPFSVDEFLAVAERTRAGAMQSSPVFADVSSNGSPILDAKVFEAMTKALPAKALRELYALTLEDVRKRTAAIRDASAAGDSAQAKVQAHALKGGCGMVGAMELRAIAADIEKGAAVNTSVLDEMNSAAERLRRMLDTLT